MHLILTFVRARARPPRDFGYFFMEKFRKNAFFFMENQKILQKTRSIQARFITSEAKKTQQNNSNLRLLFRGGFIFDGIYLVHPWNHKLKETHESDLLRAVR